MGDETSNGNKRKTDEPDRNSKRLCAEAALSLVDGSSPERVRRLGQANAGKIKRIFVRNFMCHDALEINLNPNVNFIVGQNGSGKSALLTALTVGLGARANVTDRGASVKEFIKKGKNSATVEVTIANVGVNAFKKELYGESITVVRTVGATSAYRLKSSSGKTISNKRAELDGLLNAMNIQAENPISVLNQDVSRTFLVTSGPRDKYRLFMKATRMDVVGENYKEAQSAAEEARRRLNDAEAYLSESKKQVRSLEKSLKMLDSIENARQELHGRQLEILWATAIAEEAKLDGIARALAAHETTLMDLERTDGTRETRDEELSAKIGQLRETIRELESGTSDISTNYNAIKKKYLAEKDTYSDKHKEWKSYQSKVKRTEKNISMLDQEIKRLESTNDGENENTRTKERLTKLEQDLECVEAMMRTKQTEFMHHSSYKTQLEVEERSSSNDLVIYEERVRKTRQQLTSLRSQSDSAVTIFGSDMPRLLKRINEEHAKGRFKEKPIGPLGAYIRVKDSKWTPAIESYLGAGSLGSFAVDNGHDAKILGMIVNEIMRGGRGPQIIASKFLCEVHDVSRQCTRAPNYTNLLEAMAISEPVVANCLIDQREVECVLLIPTSKEASEIMSDRRRVPDNCRRALTQQADEFFPDPHYRSYGGKVGKSKFLQISTTEAIQTLAEELVIAEEEYSTAMKRHRTIREKLQSCHDELEAVGNQVTELRAMQHKSKSTIDGIADELDVEESESVAVFTAEKAESEKKLEEEKAEESRLGAEVETIHNGLRVLEEEMKRCREFVNSVDGRVCEIKEEIRKYDNEREMLRLDGQHVNRKLREARQALQKATADHAIQKRVTDKLVSDAETHCPRIDTKMSVAEIKRTSNELRAKIQAVEQKVGSRDKLEAELAVKRAKYSGVIEFANAVVECNKRHLERLEKRRDIFKAVKKYVGAKVQSAFSSILALRHYAGSIRINHSDKTLELEVVPHNTAKRSTNDARTLSGGERSYSTVAFILALWDCTGLPFYFLDEFDVFMDKVNRRIILDILIDHTRSHPQSQFTFLTPLDTSIVKVDDYLTIHRLAPPERNNSR